MNKDHYEFNKYITKGRWISYYHQLDEVIKLSPASVLEIGGSTGFFKTMANIFNIQVETVDIDPDLNPDHVASVLALPFEDSSYDLVAAFQVLEHLPYKSFEIALSEIKRVAKNNVVISLPDARSIWRYSFHIPKLGMRNICIEPPIISPEIFKFDGEHYWEINKKDYPLERINKAFSNQGLNLDRSYRVPEHPYHRFFIFSVN